MNYKEKKDYKKNISSILLGVMLLSASAYVFADDGYDAANNSPQEMVHEMRKKKNFKKFEKLFEKRVKELNLSEGQIEDLKEIAEERDIKALQKKLQALGVQPKKEIRDALKTLDVKERKELQKLRESGDYEEFFEKTQEIREIAGAKELMEQLNKKGSLVKESVKYVGKKGDHDNDDNDTDNFQEKLKKIKLTLPEYARAYGVRFSKQQQEEIKELKKQGDQDAVLAKLKEFGAPESLIDSLEEKFEKAEDKKELLDGLISDNEIEDKESKDSIKNSDLDDEILDNDKQSKKEKGFSKKIRGFFKKAGGFFKSLFS